MLLDDDAIREIEDTLIGAALRPEAWTSAVEGLVARTGSRGAAVLPLRGRVPGVPISPSCEGLMEAYFAGGWANRDHRANGIAKMMKTGITVDQDVSTPDFMRTNPYYTDFLIPAGFQWFAGLLVARGEDAWCLTLQRTPGQGPFTPDEQVALQRMIAPLTRTAHFASTLGEARLRGMADTLDALRVAGLLLDRTGRAIHVNARAEALIGRGLDLQRGHLVAPNCARTTARLRAHVEAAIWTGLGPDDRALDPVEVERPGLQPLVVRAQPLRKVGLEYLDGARAILTIGDLEASPPVAATVLASRYALTAREIALCAQLQAGRSVAESADALNIHVSTVRTHLKRIMQKTGTGRQGELIALLLRHHWA